MGEKAFQNNIDSVLQHIVTARGDKQLYAHNPGSSLLPAVFYTAYNFFFFTTQANIHGKIYLIDFVRQMTDSIES